MQDAGYLFLLLFAVTLFVMYIAVRRAWAETLVIGGLGAILNVMFITLFSLITEDAWIPHALLAGLGAGLAFSAIVVIIASFFRTNQPSASIRLASQQERASYERQDNRRPPSE